MVVNKEIDDVLEKSSGMLTNHLYPSYVKKSTAHQERNMLSFSQYLAMMQNL